MRNPPARTAKMLTIVIAAIVVGFMLAECEEREMPSDGSAKVPLENVEGGEALEKFELEGDLLLVFVIVLVREVGEVGVTGELGLLDVGTDDVDCEVAPEGFLRGDVVDTAEEDDEVVLRAL